MSEAAAAAGRAAVRRWLRVRGALIERALSFMEEQMGAPPAAAPADAPATDAPTALPAAQQERLPRLPQWLAVHVRLTDKLLQCPYNAIDAEAVAAQALAFASGFGCDGVLVCSDDAKLKAAVLASLDAAGVRTARLDVRLSAEGRPAHMDADIDARQNAEVQHPS